MDAVGEAKARGNSQFAASEYVAALHSYTEAIQILDSCGNPSGMHVLYGNRAAAALKLGDFAAALRDAAAALAIEPRWAKALYRKAAALHGLGQLAAAANAAEQALQAEPSNPDVQALLRQLRSQVAATAAQPPPPAAAPAQEGAAAAGGGGAAAGQPPAGLHKPGPIAALLPPLLANGHWEFVPAADGVDENLLLLFHGLGDRPAAFAALARRMALPQTGALALGGPEEVPFSSGGRSWHTVFNADFELIEGRAGEQRRTRSLREAVQALQQLVGKLQTGCGYKARCIHLLGFSQGGTVALELARQQQACGQPLGSCVAVSAALLPEQLAELQQGGQQRQWQRQQGPGGGSGTATPVLITRGTRDPVVSQQTVEQTVEVLRSMHGMAVDVHSVPGKAHAMPQGEAEMRRLMQFWAQHLSRRPTAAEVAAGGQAGASSEGGEFLEVRPGEVSIELVK